ncbi:MAG: hypothetical protein CME71_10455 [Halobacteriovorax sp.]|nr:hypothetical protein [Halobacteriovorax sp.]
MDQLERKLIVFFDGYCNLCNSAVDFLIKNNKKGNLFFAPLSSQLASKLLPNIEFDSIVFYANGVVSYKSKAAFEVAKHLDWKWRWLSWLRFVPSTLSDWVYDLVAKYRYRIFGKRQTCRLASPEEEKRFLE